MSWFRYGEYVSAGQRKETAAAEIAKRKKNGEKIVPVRIDGTKITKSFWGNAWCTNLESYSDFSNRLPRGRTYVRNGSVMNLSISQGRIDALVNGSDLYTVRIDITKLPQADWAKIKAACAGQIGSLVELLQGKLSKSVMEIVSKRGEGLFPKPSEIRMSCSCPDYAGMCKHVAAAMYGVGHRLDSSPQLLFDLRCVNHLELIEAAIPSGPKGTTAPTIALDDLGELFGINIETQPTAEKKVPATKKAIPAKKTTATKKAIPAKKTTATKKAIPAKKTTATKNTAVQKTPTKQSIAQQPTAKKSTAKKPTANAKALPKKG